MFSANRIALFVQGWFNLSNKKHSINEAVQFVLTFFNILKYLEISFLLIPCSLNFWVLQCVEGVGMYIRRKLHHTGPT